MSAWYWTNAQGATIAAATTGDAGDVIAVVRKLYIFLILCAIAWFLRKVGGAKEEGNDEEPNDACAVQTPGDTSSEKPSAENAEESNGADAAQTPGDTSKKTEDDGRRYGAWGCVVIPFVLLAAYLWTWLELNVLQPPEPILEFESEFEWRERESRGEAGNRSDWESRRDSVGWRGTGIWGDLEPLEPLEPAEPAEPAETEDASAKASNSENLDAPENKETAEPTSNERDFEKTGVEP